MKTVLRKYFDKGWLKFGSRKITALDRLNVGNRFYADFYKSGIADFKIPDLEKPRVDGGNNKGTPDFVLDARVRFNAAFQTLSGDQAKIVMRVVCYDKFIKVPNLDYRHNIEVAKEKLCEGLDVLFCHYFGEPQKTKIEINGYVSESAQEDFRRWKEKILN